MFGGIDNEWNNFVNGINEPKLVGPEQNLDQLLDDDSIAEAPECEDLYISTKTKVLFLYQKIETA